jgi:hypothetical protein
LINKMVERRSAKRQPYLQSLNPHKPSMKPKATAAEDTATHFVQKSQITPDMKPDARFGVPTESSTIPWLSFLHIDSPTHLEQIATSPLWMDSTSSRPSRIHSKGRRPTKIYKHSVSVWGGV